MWCVAVWKVFRQFDILIGTNRSWHRMIHDFVADVRKVGDFLSKMTSKTSCILSRSNRKRGKVLHLHMQTACGTVFFLILALIRLSCILLYTNHWSSKFQFSRELRNGTTHSEGLITWAGLASSAVMTFIPELHELGQPWASIFI